MHDACNSSNIPIQITESQRAQAFVLILVICISFIRLIRFPILLTDTFDVIILPMSRYIGPVQQKQRVKQIVETTISYHFPYAHLPISELS